jgi:hypothetical protein
MKLFLSKVVFAFREWFLYHHDSLEFRAKVFTLMIMANSESGKCELEKLKQITKIIYPEQEHRQNILYLTVREYIKKVKDPNGLGIDELVQDIEIDLSIKVRFIKKIDLALIRKFASCTKNPDDLLYQRRVVEYLNRLKKRYLPNFESRKKFRTKLTPKPLFAKENGEA